jgi:hypothetical protein
MHLNVFLNVDAYERVFVLESVKFFKLDFLEYVYVNFLSLWIYLAKITN